MKYYGDKNVRRVYYVCGFRKEDLNDKTTHIGYINSIGKLHDYVSQLPVRGGMDGHGGYRRYPTIFCDERTRNYLSFKANGNTYWYGERGGFNAGEIAFYLEMPMITNDDTFLWHPNKKYNSKECVIEDGALEYLCIYKENGNGIVDVKYNACDNRHRNKVTIATIEIEYASNEVFIEAIKEWKTKFKASIN